MNQIAAYNGRAYETRVVIPAGDTFVFEDFVSGPFTVSVHALGVGTSALVEASTSPSATLDTPGAIYWPAPWANALGTGVIANASASVDSLSPVSALRVSAVGGDVVLEVLQ